MHNITTSQFFNYSASPLLISHNHIDAYDDKTNFIKHSMVSDSVRELYQRVKDPLPRDRAAAPVLVRVVLRISSTKNSGCVIVVDGETLLERSAESV